MHNAVVELNLALELVGEMEQIIGKGFAHYQRGERLDAQWAERAITVLRLINQDRRSRRYVQHS